MSIGTINFPHLLEYKAMLVSADWLESFDRTHNSVCLLPTPITIIIAHDRFLCD
jgi:hypothetical protein